MNQAAEQPRVAQMEPPGLQQAWQMVSNQLSLEMRRGTYDSWVKPLVPVGYKEGVFRLAAVNSYGRDWVESHLRNRIKGLLEGVYGRPVSVTFTLIHLAQEEAAQAEQEAARETEPAAANSPAGAEGNPQRSPAAGMPQVQELPAAVPVPPAKAKADGAGRKKNQPAAVLVEEGASRKIQLQRAYGTERARIIQPERGMFLTLYFLNRWLPLLGHSAATTVMAARSLCYWNPMTGELRNVIETDMSELARRAAVSLRTVKEVLNTDLIKRYFLRYKVRRVMTPNGVRTAGIILQVRMDDPLTPEDQDANNLPEDEHWYTIDIEDE